MQKEKWHGVMLNWKLYSSKWTVYSKSRIYYDPFEEFLQLEDSARDTRDYLPLAIGETHEPIVGL